MACASSYEQNFVKIAEDAGFSFDLHKPRTRIDWNKIRSIDIDRVIRDRHFVTIEHHVNDVLNGLLETEFDCRILDEGVVKLFRLAQLTIEYQQFCRHHLNKSIMLLREEIVSIMQEVDRHKRTIRSKDDEIRKLKKKSKQSHKSPIPSFGNENIAAMILKTLSNNENVATPDFGDGIQQYNKCKYCDKVFLNQLYLKGHMLRRHQALIEQDKLIAENNKLIANQQEAKTEQENKYLAENIKLHKEIDELKTKLQDMGFKLEETNTKLTEISATNKKDITSPEQEIVVVGDSIQQTNDDQNNILKKIEEWKIEEEEKHKMEFNMLKEQILENIMSFNIQQNESSNKDLVEQLRNTVKNQNIEIASLKQEMKNMIQNIEKINEQRELELKKLQYNSPPRVVKVDAEQQYESLTASPTKSKRNDLIDFDQHKYNNKPRSPNSDIVDKNHIKHYPNTKTMQKLADRQKSLEELHKKTQELLNIESSTDSSTSIEENFTPKLNQRSPIKQKYGGNKKTKADITIYREDKNHNTKNDIKKIPKKQKKIMKQKSVEVIESPADENDKDIIHTSPAKIVRAKITEEVHKRLVAAGVDPLKSGVNSSLFEKQKAKLRHEEEIKKKKSQNYEKIRHKILAYLDSKAAETLAIQPQSDHRIINEDKRNKNFKLSSVLSNVKNKALSLIKSNEKKNIFQRESLNEDIFSQKKSHFLKTPPSSVPESPINQGRISRASTDSNISSSPKKPNKPSKKTVIVEVNKHNLNLDSDTDGIDSIDEIYKEKNNTIPQSKSVENLINSPVKRPNNKNNYNISSLNENRNQLYRAQSTALLDYKSKDNGNITTNITRDNHNEMYVSPDKSTNNMKKYLSDDNVFISNNQNVTKGVLKNAPSTSSLSKKKVIFDLDANQTKSVSASPSQSNTEKSDPNVEDAVETLNLEEEWDISSIESVPIMASRETLSSSKTTLKVAELTQRIESQLALRKDNKPPAGSIDVLRGLPRGGSNTSLGSSVLDDSDEPKPNIEKSSPLDKDASDIDLSEFSLDGVSKYKINVK